MLRKAKWIVPLALVALAFPVMAAEKTDASTATAVEKTRTDERKTALTPEEVKASMEKKGPKELSAEEADRIQKTATETRKTALTPQEAGSSKTTKRAVVSAKDVEEMRRMYPGG